MKSIKLHIATAASRTATDWQTKEVTWEQLKERCREPLRTAESVAQYFAMTKEDQGKAKDHGGFVGGTLKGKRRIKENMVSRDLVTLDLDHAKPGFWDGFKRIYRGYEAFIYSTHSHTPENPRLRLIMPLAHSVPAEAYEPIARSVAFDLGMDQFDDTTYQAVRLMYFPSCPKDGEYVFEEQAGEPLNPDVILSGYDDWHNAEDWPTSSREAKRTISGIRKMEDPLLKQGIVGDFCRLYSVPEAIDKFLPEIYEPGTSKNRYTYKPGSTSNGLVIYDDGKYAHAFQSTDPLCGEHSYNAFDLVRLHLFGRLDKEKDQDKPVAERPSWRKMVNLVYEDEAFQEAQISSRLDEAKTDFADVPTEEEQAKEDANAWRKRLELVKGSIAKTVGNFQLMLENLPEFKGRIWFDEFERIIKVCGRLPWDKRKVVGDRPFLSRDYNMLNAYFLDKYGFSVSRQSLMDSVVYVADKHARHPIYEYLESLRWDGVPRLDTLFIDFLAAPDTELIRAITRKHLVAAVKRIFEPGCKYDTTIVFTGDQGAGKSTIIKRLGGDWAKPLSSKFEGREAIEQFSGAWLLESEELRGWKGAALESIKAFFSRNEDTMRPAYGMTTDHYPRHCVFFATTNDSIFLNDITGNRRFWPIQVYKDRAKYSVWDDLTDTYRDQIWAEAMVRYREGEKVFLNREQEKELLRTQVDFTDPYFADLVDTLRTYLEIRLPQDWYNYTKKRRAIYFRLDAGDDFTANMRRDKVCYAEIKTECFEDGRFQGRAVTPSEIARAMDELPEWKKSTKSTNFGSNYGRQRYFERIVDPLDSEDLETL